MAPSVQGLMHTLAYFICLMLLGHLKKVLKLSFIDDFGSIHCLLIGNSDVPIYKFHIMPLKCLNLAGNSNFSTVFAWFEDNLLCLLSNFPDMSVNVVYVWPNASSSHTTRHNRAEDLVTNSTQFTRVSQHEDTSAAADWARKYTAVVDK